MGSRTKHAERVPHRGAIVAILAEPLGGPVRAHGPGRAMSGQGIALIDRDILRAHAVEIIVGRIVFANVVEAKTEELPFPVPALGRTKFPGRGAAGIVATRLRRGRGRRLLGRLDPDTVEKAGVEIHGSVIMGVF